MIVRRSKNNPILKPNNDQPWEAEAVCNGCPIKMGDDVVLVYRAISKEHYHSLAQQKMVISDIGITRSKDGVNFGERRRFIVPESPWEKYGCEDPRITYLNGKYYIFYTALSAYPFRAEGIQVGVGISNDLENVTEKHLVTPFNSKAMALFPEKINGKFWVIVSVNTDLPPSKICIAELDKESDLWNQDFWESWYREFGKHALNLTRKDSDQVEVGAVPVLTENGWLVVYSYIRNYFSNDRLFTIEAALLNKDNPREILARTDMPILVPEEYYEKHGIVPNVVFPSGVLIDKDWLNIYYGAADTTCCMAQVELSSLLELMLQREKRVIKLSRFEKNPLISPIKEHAWEAKATFNPAAIKLNDKIHILYRAMSADNTSTLGYAVSSDGLNIDYRSQVPIYVPREAFEQKSEGDRFSGCEDPRLTQIDDKIYMCYTAYDGKNVPRVAFSTIGVKDFLDWKWKWNKPVLISPPDFDDKDAFIFPEKVKGKFLVIHRSGTDMDYAFVDNLNFDGSSWIEENRWISPRLGWWDSRKIGSAGPPLKTSEGWIQLYHGVSESNIYRVGAILLDLEDPTKVIGRTEGPILEPEKDYEVRGEVANVVFPCGAVQLGRDLFVYYGAADKVLGVATCDIDELIRVLKLCKV